MKLILVVGGARSGKSEFAEARAGRDRRVAYIATGVAFDDEMVERVQRHQRRRPATWRTHEQKVDVDRALPGLCKTFDAVLLDSLTQLITNLLLADEGANAEANALLAVDRLLRASEHGGGDMVIVSDEVGCGIVPENRLARQFRDILGLANQRVAAKADEVYYVVAGIGMKIKPKEEPK
jgi:adenosylcobinamide kinase / adenosylcobinamide-phosphate guanylyltransferase